METNIEEDIRDLKEISEWFELFVKAIIEDKRFAEFKEYNMIKEQKYKKTPFGKTIENILADRERLEKENKRYKIALFMVIRNSMVMPKGIELGKSDKEINKMSYETMCEVLTMINFKEAEKMYEEGTNENR